MISQQNDVHKQKKVAKEDDSLGILIGIPVGKAADFTLCLFANRKSQSSFHFVCGNVLQKATLKFFSYLT